MSRKNRTTLSTVEKLIEQRRLFQDWMEKLAAGVDGMPAHVVERVRNDYRERLTGVMTELAEHRDGLREALEEAQERHDALDDQHQAKKDELAELRLRRHVGEMDEGRFKEQSGAMQGVMDQLKKDLASALRDIERFEEILDVIAEGDKKPEPEPEPVAAKEEKKAEKPAAEAPARTERTSSQDVKAAVPADELDFLRSVTSAASIKVPANLQQKNSTDGKAAAPAAAAAAAPPPPPAPPAPPPPPPAAVEPPKKKEEPVAVAFEAAPGLLKLPVAEAEPEAAAKPAPAAPTAPAKNENAGLTCGECGAVNRPTEWYCEKCGAELAAF